MRGRSPAFAALVAATVDAVPLAPNTVAITPSLVTSGQPSRDTLGRLREQGFGGVVYLAPPTVHDAMQDEPVILNRQSIAFVNIPIESSGRRKPITKRSPSR